MPAVESTRGVFVMMVDSIKDVDRRMIPATALLARAPAPETFRKGRDFAAWVGLTPLQKSTGGKQKLGAISKMVERTLRRLLTGRSR